MTRTIIRGTVLIIGMTAVAGIFWYLFRMNIFAANESFPFDIPGDYTYDSALIDVSGGVASLIEIDQLDDDNDATDGFGAGTFSDTQFDSGNGWLELDATGVSNGSGTFTSRIIDAGDDVSWDALSWIPNEPYLKELPNNGVSETAYSDQNVNMSENELLLHLNESTGATTFDDDSGNGNDGTCSNCPTAEVDGFFSTAVDFDGNDDEIELPSSVADGVGDISISVWFKTTKTGQQAFISGANASNNNEFLWFLDDDEEMRLYAGETASGFTSWGISSIADGDWHHFVMVRDAGNDEATLYLDGVSQGTNSVTLSGLSIDSGGLFIAQEQDSVGGGFVSSQSYDGVMDEYAIFHDVLDASEAESLYKRGAHRVTYQVRSCNDSACSGEPFIGPNGTVGSEYSELNNTSAGLPSISLTNVSDNRYFQYEVTIETDDTASPEIQEVEVGPDHYPASNPTIENNTGFPFSGLESFAEVLGVGNEGTVEYQVSNDGTNFYYHNGSLWLSESGLGYPTQTNSSTEVNDQIASFVTDVGNGDFYFKAFLHSENGEEAVELDQVVVSTGSAPGAGQQDLILVPEVDRFVINDDADCTTERQVAVQSNVIYAEEMLLSEDPNFVGAAWEPFLQTQDFTLSTGSGEKVIYAIYRSATRNTSLKASDTIEFDPEGICDGELQEPIEPTVPEEPEETAPPVVAPPSPSPGPLCEVNCDRLSYDVYIVNPDGSERHVGSDFVKEVSLGGDTLLLFEDSGSDFDHNDLVFRLNPNDCRNVRVSLIGLDAGWHHQIRMKIYFDQFIREDLLLWEDSHMGFGESKRIDVRELETICSIQQRLEGEPVKPSETSPTEPVPTSPEANSCTSDRFFTAFMGQGSVSAEVRDLQELLQCLGFFPENQPPTAIFGPITAQAVSTFQSESGINPVGYVGPGTREALNKYVK